MIARTRRTTVLVSCASAALLAGATACAATPSAVPAPSPQDVQLDDVSTLSVGAELEGRPIVPSDETADGGKLPDGYVYATDDYSMLSVAIPDTWTDVRGTPYADADGNQWAYLRSAPDVDAYVTTWDAAGLEFAGTYAGFELPDAALTSFAADLSPAFDQACTRERVGEPYDDGYYRGRLSTWTDCGGVGTSGLVITAQDPAAAHVVYLRGKFVTPEERSTALPLVLNSFYAFIAADGTQSVPTKSAPDLG